MATFEKLTIPSKGEKIQVANGKLQVPDHPIIGFIYGDGIGTDISKTSQAVFDAAVEKAYHGKRKIEWLRLFAGLSALQTYGMDKLLPEDTIRAIQEFGVAIKGPLTTPVGSAPYVCMECAYEQGIGATAKIEKCVKCGSQWVVKRFRSMNVTLRQMLDLYACVRPVKWIPGIPSPMKAPEKVNVVIFRENTEDVYAGIEFEQGQAVTEEVINFISAKIGKKIRPDSGIGIKPISIFCTKRLVRRAIAYAIAQNRKSVTLVHKGNIMKFTEGAFRDWGYQLAKDEFRDKIVTEQEVTEQYHGKAPAGKVIIKDRIADSMFQQMLLRPDEYEVLATPNLNGDYLSDACAAQVGGLGIAPGANIGDSAALFEPTHGTAPKYAGQDKVNPSSLILSGILMFEHLKWQEAADMISNALEKTVAQKIVTYDLERQMQGAKLAKCSEFGQAIIKNM